jgi:hypothetical protein
LKFAERKLHAFFDLGASLLGRWKPCFRLLKVKLPFSLCYSGTYAAKLVVKKYEKTKKT